MTQDLSINKNRIIKSIAVAELFRVMGRSGVWIFLPVYMLLRFSSPFIYITLGFVIPALVDPIINLFGGNIMDVYGRRKVALIIPIMNFMIFLFLFIAIYFSLGIMYLEIPFIAIGPLASLQGNADNVIISDVTKEAERVDSFSYIRIAANVGFALGPTIAGLSVSLNYSLLPIVPMIAEIITFIIYFINIRETVNIVGKSVEKPLFSFPKNDKKFVAASLLISLSYFSLGAWSYMLAQFLAKGYGMSTFLIGLIFATNGVVVAAFQIPTNRIFRNFNEAERIFAGLLIYAVTFFIIGVTRNFYILILDIAVLTIGENVISPSTLSLISKISPPEKRGEYFGGFSLVNSIFNPISPLFYEALLFRLMSSPILLWGIVGLLPGLVSIMVLFYLRRI